MNAVDCGSWQASGCACPHRGAEGPLHNALVQMVTPVLAGRGMDGHPRRREHPLPDPLATGVGILPPQRGREFHPAGTARQIAPMLAANALEVGLERRSNSLG
jgi:hypothetical protein